MDIILDDGGHTMEQQKVSFKHIFSKVKQGAFILWKTLARPIGTSFMVSIKTPIVLLNTLKT